MTEIAILVLSIYVLTALLAQTLFRLPPAAATLLDQIDWFVCAIFLADFAARFYRAPSKLAFLRWGWIDLLSSIPVLDSLRWGRLVRIVRILRALRSARHVAAVLYRHRARSAGVAALLITFLLVAFCSVAVLVFESGAEATIRTPLDAFWWAVSTMTTVGYGDKYPMTVEGKVVAMILMVAGVALFGVLTGLFARFFTEPDAKREDSMEIATLAAEVRLLREQIEALRCEQRGVSAHERHPLLLDDELSREVRR